MSCTVRDSCTGPKEDLSEGFWANNEEKIENDQHKDEDDWDKEDLAKDAQAKEYLARY